MESKPVINFSPISGVMDVSTSSQSKKGFIAEHVIGDNITCTKNIAPAPGVETVDEYLGLIVPVTNIPDLVERTKTYLKSNGIGCGHFASEVLNVNSPYFASMCSQKAGFLTKEWSKLSPKMQVCYSRMAFWMEKIATTANPVTPQAEVTTQKKGKGKSKGKGKRKGNPMKSRTLLDSIRRKHKQEAGSSYNSKGFHHGKPDGDADGKARNEPKAIVEEEPIGIGEYFAAFMEEDLEILEFDVTVIEVDEGNFVTYTS